MSKAKQFGSNEQPYPSDMRTQLWPLCCGAQIISGFKSVGPLKEDELIKKIESLCDEYTPDHQVFAGEKITPHLTYLTLNESQWNSKKIRDAVLKAGFKLFAEASPRHSSQYFLVRDLSRSFKLVTDDKAA